MRGVIAARKLLQRLDIRECPIRIEAVCHQLGIGILYRKMGEPSGCYAEDPITRRTFIVINENKSWAHKRFSAAHELGHAILRHPPGAMMMGGLKLNPYDKRLETEADHFAAEFLMPKNLLVSRGYMTAEEIARLCRVSITAARIRAERLGWL